MVSDKQIGVWDYECKCLNPCSNGIWSLTLLSLSLMVIWINGLNPCSNGIWSLTYAHPDTPAQIQNVLILVLMEYGL